MQRSPRIPSLAGYSSQGALLLALVGAGVAAFLLFVLPRMSASRAAGPAPGHRPEPAAVDGRPPAEEMQLVPVAELEPELPPVQLTEAPAAAAAALTEVETEPVKVAKVEGPKLKYDRGPGKAEEIDNKDLRAPRREYRKERRERAAAAAAQGFAVEAPPDPQKAKAAPNPDRWRVSNRSGTGRTGIGKGKGKKGG